MNECRDSSWLGVSVASVSSGFGRYLIAVALLVGLLAASGCGLESAGTAATAGAAKQMELEQARKTQEEVRQQLQQSMDQMQKRNEQLDGVAQ